MKYALITDVHANLPALEAVLRDIAGRPSVQATYHLGDLVGYAPWPNETVALLRSRGIAGVAGNYDSTTASNYKHCGCKYENPTQETLSHQSFEWTKAHVNDETRRYLSDLPFRIDLRPRGGHLAAGPRVVLVHGTPLVNTQYWTEDRPDAFCMQMAQQAGLKSGDAIAFGHTHQLWHHAIEDIHFVNCGTAGRPKDRDPRVSYALLDVHDTGEITTEFVRVEYEVARAAQAIRRSGLPDAFADFLETGGAVPWSAPVDAPSNEYP
jgi:predicted phosphodiesterase